MKIFLTVSILFLVCGTTLVHAETPLLMKGQTSDDIYHSQICNFTSLKVKMISGDGHGGEETLTKRTIHSRSKLAKLIKLARLEKLQTADAPSDMNHGTISARYWKNGKRYTLTLRRLENHTTPFFQLRDGDASRKLIAITSKYCPDIE